MIDSFVVSVILQLCWIDYITYYYTHDGDNGDICEALRHFLVREAVGQLGETAVRYSS